MLGHRFLKNAIIKDLTFDRKTKQGAYYLRRLHVFYKNECILEIDFTGFLHTLLPLANIGEISFHLDAGTSLDSLSYHGKKKPSSKKRKRKK